MSMANVELVQSFPAMSTGKVWQAQYLS